MRACLERVDDQVDDPDDGVRQRELRDELQELRHLLGQLGDARGERAVGSGGGPSESGMAFTQLKTATTVSMMSNTGISGVSAGWMASIRLNCWMLTPPGSVMTGGSPSSRNFEADREGHGRLLQMGRRWAGRRGRRW